MRSASEVVHHMFLSASHFMGLWFVLHRFEEGACHLKQRLVVLALARSHVRSLSETPPPKSPARLMMEQSQRQRLLVREKDHLDVGVLGGIQQAGREV